MLSCCSGHGIQEFKHVGPKGKPFSKYYFLKESATLIGCTYLVAELETRMQLMSNVQIHSDDVRDLYNKLPANHPMLQTLSQHVATLQWNGSLKARPAYDALRVEFPQFEQDMNSVLDPLVAERRQEKQKQQQEQRKTRTMKESSGGKSKAKEAVKERGRRVHC